MEIGRGNGRGMVFTAYVGTVACLAVGAAPVSAQAPRGPSERSTPAVSDATQLSLSTPYKSIRLGASAALSADGSTALLGAPNRKVHGMRGAGAAAVFRLMHGHWNEQSELDLGAKARADDTLGQSVALDADGNVAMLGSNRRNGGSVEVFRYAGGAWRWSAEITGNGIDRFGESVALDGSGDRAVAGAPYSAVDGKQVAGAAVVMRLEGNRWVKTATLSLHSNAVSGDGLGNSVAMSADGNTVLVGVVDRNVDGNADNGAAEVFHESGSTWGPATQLDLGASAGFDLLGSAVALSSDGDTAIVGAPDRHVTGLSYLNDGAAEVYRFSNKWSAPTELSLGSDAVDNDFFGNSVALDASGDTALVGAPFRDIDGLSNRGAGEVFRFSGGAWGSPEQLALSYSSGGQPVRGDFVGYRVALSSTGDTALLGAPGRYLFDDHNAGAGEVFVP